ncbi:hypothetical protein [Natrinema gari]|uniref:hypothetical protein n=1 Tax=Natrinema gari TaxID=419186 RepID=UPI001268F035|nr:hypothetical protein [Natrinema gari]
MGNPAATGLSALLGLFIVGAVSITMYGGDPNALASVFKPIFVIGVFVALAVGAIGAVGAAWR